MNESFDLKKRDQTGAKKFDPCADTFIRIGLSLLSLIPAIALVTTTINFITRLINAIKIIPNDIFAWELVKSPYLAEEFCTMFDQPGKVI